MFTSLVRSSVNHLCATASSCVSSVHNQEAARPICPRLAFTSNVDLYSSSFFFFQAEDGIRDLIVTGVQTCALPISFQPRSRSSQRRTSQRARPRGGARGSGLRGAPLRGAAARLERGVAPSARRPEIGRASCRERV